MGNPTLAATMTPFPYSIPHTESIRAAKAMMAEHDVHHLPVKEGTDVVGVVSARDLILAEALGGSDADAMELATIVTRDVYVVDIHAPLADVVTTLAERHIGSAIIIREDKLAGILTVTDVCRAFAATLDGPEPRDSVA